MPALYHDNHSVAPPRTIEEGYHLSADIADRAIEYLADLRAVDNEQRFFLYLATGACHSPHHAPQEWLDRYRGQFDDGWDAYREHVFTRQLAEGILPAGTELTPRPPWVPEFDSLHPDDQRVAARFMECFAAYLSYTDAQLGRVVAFLAETGDLDDTLIVLVSDNGASSEGGVRGSINDVRLWNGLAAGRKELRERIEELGGPNAHNNYPWGWTMAGNTPFQRWKREVHEGGVADPCIVRLPARIRAGAGSVRHQFAHAIDVVPTVLEIIGVEAPATIREVPQSTIDGVSFAYALGDDAGAAQERHTTQYFEMLGCRAIYHDGWKAVTFKPPGRIYDDGIDPDAPFDDDRWELYDKRRDFAECHDLAAEEPGRLDNMVALWWDEARKNDVLPLDNRPLAALENPRPRRAAARHRYVHYPHTAPVPETVAVNVRNRIHTITASVTVADGRPPEGVLLAMGSALGGFALYLREGRLSYVHNLVGRARDRVVSSMVVGPGDHDLTCEYTPRPDFSGSVRLLIDAVEVGNGDVVMFTPRAVLDHGRRAHVRVRTRPSGGGRLRGAVPVHRDDPSRGGGGGRTRAPRPRVGARGHHERAMSASRRRAGVVTAPARVNLIGDHTDYQDGLCVPMAIDRRVEIEWTQRDDRTISMRSDSIAGPVTVDLDTAYCTDDSPAWGRVGCGNGPRAARARA